MRRLLLFLLVLFLAGCASVPKRDPLQVSLAGIESVRPHGLKLRMAVRLRIQNPNDVPIPYEGVALQMDVQGKAFAHGVSDASGSVPRYGETLIRVPVTLSAWNVVRHVKSLKGMRTAKAAVTGKLHYALKGKLETGGSSAERFASTGEFDLHRGLKKLLD